VTGIRMMKMCTAFQLDSLNRTDNFWNWSRGRWLWTGTGWS